MNMVLWGHWSCRWVGSLYTFTSQVFKKFSPLHKKTAATAKRQSITELQGGVTPREIINFLVRYCILSVVVVFNLELRKENSDCFLPPAALFYDHCRSWSCLLGEHHLWRCLAEELIRTYSHSSLMSMYIFIFTCM